MGSEYPRMSDGDLEQAAIQGDHDAFAELYARHFARVYDFVRRLVGSPQAADDLTQDTFLRALKSLSPKRRNAKYSTYLFTIARNLAINWLEKERSRSARFSAEDDALFWQVDSARFADPAEAAAAEGLADLVWTAARSLDPKQHSLLDLHLRQGLESAEIADVVGVSKGAAYTMMSRLKDTFESAVSALLLTRHGIKHCAHLGSLLEEHKEATAITPELRRLVEQHASACAACQETRRQLVSPTALLGGLAAVPAPPGLRERIAEAAVGSWTQAGVEAAGGTKGAGTSLASKFGGLSPVSKLMVLGGAMMLLIVGGGGGWLLTAGEGETDNGSAHLKAVSASETATPRPSSSPSPVPLTAGGHYPISAEGTILFLAAGSSAGDESLFSAAPDGSQLRELLTEVVSFAASPDGTRILFTRRVENEETQSKRIDLFVAPSVDVSRAVRLTNWGGVLTAGNPWEFYTSPLWSPDSSHIAFYCCTGSVKHPPGIYIVDAESPSEPKLAISTQQIADTLGLPRIEEIHDGSIWTQLSPFTWTADGERIAFYWWYSARIGEDTEEGAGVWSMNLSGSDPSTIMNFDDPLPSIVKLAGAPDGDLLAVYLQDRSGRDADLLTVAWQGKALRNVTATGSPGLNGHGGVAWSPDGTRVAFAPYTAGLTHHGVHIVEIGSGSLTPIAVPPDDPLGRLANGASLPVWSPDGDYVAFVSEPNTLLVAAADGSATNVVIDGWDAGVGSIRYAAWIAVELAAAPLRQ